MGGSPQSGRQLLTARPVALARAGSFLVLPPYLLVFVLTAIAWHQAFTRAVALGRGRLTAIQTIGCTVLRLGFDWPGLGPVASGGTAC